MAELVHYRGCQYPVDRLPAGADPAEVTPLDEWFAANRTEAPKHKAILAPVAGGPAPTKAVKRK
ncbi:hypothetical protein [Candidatus Neomicrothrix sp.]|uniref:hypothetical protein n=1 Tax=Candidatus Neomicrothrix sp. TaxID=2719034 RepID=UPI001B5A55EB|nr:hypothetical protein [Candidatus Microthrix sp.]MBP6136575.1 hypothetical protein [Candidatus Microthrix sp.]MBP6151602.1 hypothetical protein [Candidatus Microthrix sp.]